MNHPVHEPAGRDLADYLVELSQVKQAENPVILDLREYPAAAQWYVICEADNVVHTRAVAEWIRSELKQRFGVFPARIEGYEDGRWVCVDYIDVVIHIMLPEIRDYYSIEEIWNKSNSTTPPPSHNRD